MRASETVLCRGAYQRADRRAGGTFRRRWERVAMCAALAALIVCSPALMAAVPQTLSFQGVIRDTAGTPVDGNVMIQFAIYDAAAGGSPLWTDTLEVVADQGLINATLGSDTNPFPASLFQSPRFLGLTIGADPELTPRIPFTSVGYSFNAENAATLEGFSAAALNQSAHVTDTNNPHQVTAAQVGAPTTADLGTATARIDGLQTAVAGNTSDISTLQGNTVLTLDGRLGLNAGSRMDMDGTFRTMNNAGSFEIFNLGTSGGSVLMGALKGTSAPPQFRFQADNSLNFIDIGQDSLERFVIENQSDRTLLSLSRDNDLGLGQSTTTGRIAVNMPFVNVATVAIRGRAGDIAYLDVFQPGGTTEIFRVTDNGVEVLNGFNAFKPGGGPWAAFSDRRLKKDIQPLEGALERLLALRSVSFEFKDPAATGELPGRQVGFVAQEVEPLFPNWVSESKDGYKCVAPKGFESLTVAALRELRREKDAQIEALQAENAALRNALASFEDRLTAIEHRSSAVTASISEDERR